MWTVNVLGQERVKKAYLFKLLHYSKVLYNIFESTVDGGRAIWNSYSNRVFIFVQQISDTSNKALSFHFRVH